MTSRVLFTSLLVAAGLPVGATTLVHYSMENLAKTSYAAGSTIPDVSPSGAHPATLAEYVYGTHGYYAPVVEAAAGFAGNSVRDGVTGLTSRNQSVLTFTQANDKLDGNGAALRVEEAAGDTTLHLQTFTVEFMWKCAVSSQRWAAPLSRIRVDPAHPPVVRDGTEASTLTLFVSNAHGRPVQCIVTTEVGGGTSVKTLTLGTNTGIVDGAWHHVALTLDGTTHALTLFIDGTAVGSATLDGPLVYQDANPWVFGGHGYFGWQAGGSMDEIRISDQVLAPSEFLQVAQADALACYSLTGRQLSFAANADGSVTNLHVLGDTTGMNWVHVADGSQYHWIRADKAWGTGTVRVDGRPASWSVPVRRETAADGTERLVYATANHESRATNHQVEVCVTRRLERAGTALYERYEFVNVSDEPVSLSEIDIHTPFNDNYPRVSTEMFARRCHAHVWPGGAGAWVAAMRMGGAAPHLGLAVVEGAVDAYELKERALEKGLSNVRGVIALSPPDVRLPPGGRTAVGWRVFVQRGWDDFFARLREMGGADVRADRYVVRTGETVKITARMSRRGASGTPECGDLPAEETWTRDWTCPGPGGYRVDISFGPDRSRTSHVEILGVADPDALVLARARFIVAHQQVNDPGSPYDGAFVPYDNETDEIQCRWKTGTAAAQRSLDHAEGAERLGMGVFLAVLAQRGHKDEFLPALRRYHRFVRQGLQDADCSVWQTVARPVRPRAFNYPWVIWFHLEMYRLTGEMQYLDDMYGTFRRLLNGSEDMADALVAFPLGACVEALEAAGRTEDAKRTRELACAYLANVASFNGTFKSMEVGMAPEMVSGCLSQLLDLHRVTGETRYLDTARRFIPLGEAILGRQPSWHAHDIGLHHWDGYWFGKRACWGDTLPHDWNGEMAVSFQKYAAVTGEASFAARARGIADAMLGLFTPDGRGTCGWVYPTRVNGKPAHFADPLANDQDWALVFYLLSRPAP